MKIEDLHTLRIYPFKRVLEGAGSTLTDFGGDFARIHTGTANDENMQEALQAAALFRSAKVMQEALKEAIQYLEKTKNGMIVLGDDSYTGMKSALAMSENTNEKI